MAYTVTKLAKLSGVSVRTLHWYDRIGLLQPAYHGANGYRFYEEKQLLLLQQILFFRELGFELKQIQKVLGQSDFDKLSALSSHRGVLKKTLERTKKLIETIDNTINHLKGVKKMKDPEFYHGFSKEKQKEYEKQILERFGEKGKAHMEECRQQVEKWQAADWDRSQKEFAAICRELADLMGNQKKTSSKEVQSLIQRHYQWLKQFWTPNRESYTGHGQFIVQSDLRKAYEAFHPHLPEYIAEAIELFAKHELA